MKRNLKIGIALGSGSARGWSHIGVLRALEKAGIRPQIVCGSSIGALVGERREELVDQVAVSGVNLDNIESGAVGAMRRIGESLHRVGDLRGRARVATRQQGPLCNQRVALVHVTDRSAVRQMTASPAAIATGFPDSVPAW